MGEFAKYNGKEIKIGTCEDMYYLRADQADKVTALEESLDPILEHEEIRFRFPFPDEDKVEPGDFNNPHRSQGLYGLPVSTRARHEYAQFTNSGGYLVSLPCPEFSMQMKTDQDLQFHRNGNPGPVRIVQQRAKEGKLMLVLECGGCGAKWRLDTLEEAQPVIDICLKNAKTHGGDPGYWTKLAERIKAGYTDGYPWLKMASAK